MYILASSYSLKFTDEKYPSQGRGGGKGGNDIVNLKRRKRDRA
jgi:hypothetical protein